MERSNDVLCRGCTLRNKKKVWRARISRRGYLRLKHNRHRRVCVTNGGVARAVCDANRARCRLCRWQHVLLLAVRAAFRATVFCRCTCSASPLEPRDDGEGGGGRLRLAFVAPPRCTEGLQFFFFFSIRALSRVRIQVILLLLFFGWLIDSSGEKKHFWV